MRKLLIAALLLAVAPAAWGQAIIGFTGGSQFDSYYGSAAGDVVGYRFEVFDLLEVSDLGVWNADSSGGLSTDHEVGIWDSSQTLLAQVIVGPTGTPVGDWTYEPITPIVLNPGEVYTIGAMYRSADGDSYVSGATTMDTDPDVGWINSVYPAAAELGFVFPTSDSTSFGRFGPNFLFTVVPVELMSFTIE